MKVHARLQDTQNVVILIIKKAKVAMVIHKPVIVIHCAFPLETVAMISEVLDV